MSALVQYKNCSQNYCQSFYYRKKMNQHFFFHNQTLNSAMVYVQSRLSEDSQLSCSDTQQQKVQNRLWLSEIIFRSWWWNAHFIVNLIVILLAALALITHPPHHLLSPNQEPLLSQSYYDLLSGKWLTSVRFLTNLQLIWHSSFAPVDTVALEKKHKGASEVKPGEHSETPFDCLRWMQPLELLLWINCMPACVCVLLCWLKAVRDFLAYMQ